MNVVFFIIVVLMLVMQIGMIASTKSTRVCIVKAGDVTIPQDRYTTINSAYKMFLYGKNISNKGLEMMAVRGNSAEDYHIYDHQYIWVQKYNSTEEKNSIKTHPMLVINITEDNLLYTTEEQSKYKLRKFVGYVNDLNSENWRCVYETYKDLIKISAEDFQVAYTHKANKYINCGYTGRFILSETKKNRVVTYSLHPVDTLYAYVRYAS